MEKINLKLSGLHCAGCAGSVSRILNRISGVNDIKVNSKSARFTTNESSEEFITTIITGIERLGYQAELV